MKTHTQWRQLVEAWRGSGLSQADYCRQQSLNSKTFSAWARRIRRESSLDKDAPLKIISVQVTPSAAAASIDANVMLRFPHGAQLELSTTVSPRWLAELLQCLA